MPTYEYKCDACGHVFEQFQNITDKPLQKCPSCGSGVRRMISSGAGIIFKGKGFYQTDYKNGKTEACGEGERSPCGGSGTCPACEANA